MRSLLAQPDSPFPHVKIGNTDRSESVFTIKKNGKLYTFTAKDKIAVEDPYVVLAKAIAYAIRHGTGYPGAEPSRVVRDYIIKSSVVHIQ